MLTHGCTNWHTYPASLAPPCCLPKALTEPLWHPPAVYERYLPSLSGTPLLSTKGTYLPSLSGTPLLSTKGTYPASLAPPCCLPKALTEPLWHPPAVYERYLPSLSGTPLLSTKGTYLPSLSGTPLLSTKGTYPASVAPPCCLPKVLTQPLWHPLAVYQMYLPSLSGSPLLSTKGSRTVVEEPCIFLRLTLAHGIWRVASKRRRGGLKAPD